MQTDSKDHFLSLDFGLQEFGVRDEKERLRRYRRFLYETGTVDTGKGATLDAGILSQEREKAFRVTRRERFKYRTRYFTDSGIIGGKAFVLETYRKVKDGFPSGKEKIPKPVTGLNGIYSLKRLTE